MRFEIEWKFDKDGSLLPLICNVHIKPIIFMNIDSNLVPPIHILDCLSSMFHSKTAEMFSGVLAKATDRIDSTVSCQ